MTAAYPGTIKSFTTLVNNVDRVLAAHANERGEEITAIETWLFRALALGTHVESRTLSGNLTLADTDKAIQKIDCNGANREVYLPVTGPDNHQQVIVNVTTATYTITVKQTNTSGNIIGFLPPNKAVVFLPTGAGWYMVGGAPLGPSGWMHNGRISVSVASNDLVVAIKTMAGNDPGITNPVWVRIGNELRVITAATSITVPDGTNYFNAGGTVLGGNLVGFFPYAVWDSNSAIVALTIARIPWAALVSDFSATTTNENHGFNYANFTTTDEVENIGYFEATLSLTGTGHLWTVPTFTAANLIQRPVFETHWLTSNYVASGLTIGDGTVNVHRYKLGWHRYSFYSKFTLGSTSSISNPIITPAFSPTANQILYDGSIGGARFNDIGTANYLGAVIITGGGALQPVAYITNATYAGLTGLSATVPHTWANTDTLGIEGEFEV